MAPRTRYGRRSAPVEAAAPAHRASARMSAVSSLVFAALLVLALVLVHEAPGLGVPDSVYTRFYAVGHRNVLVTVGLYVVPFAGIAFLWHVSALRTFVEDLPGPRSEVQRWIQLSSGVVFVCMLFAGTAAVGAVALLTRLSTTPPPPPDVARALGSAGYGLVFVFAVRAAGMYMIATTQLVQSRRLLPRWLAVLSYLAATFLLVSTTFHPAVLLVLPGWAVLLGVVLLRAARREAPGPPGADVGPSVPAVPRQPAQEAPHEHHDPA